ncbi:MAG TPA: type IV secretion system protein [Candidatus Paceibacterota bacterium]
MILRSHKKLKLVLTIICLLLVFGLQARSAFAGVATIVGDRIFPGLGPLIEATAGRSAPTGIYCWPDLLHFSLTGCILKGTVFMGYLGLSFFGWLLGIVGQFFNLIIMLQNQAFKDQPFVETGWLIARDVSNIFYIFVLLVISIGTILRIDQFNWKGLLPRLIISALLINFSLALTGVIVDAGNVLGNTFYLNIGGETEIIPGTGMMGHDISGAMVRGLNPYKVYEVGNQQAAANSGDATSMTIDTLINVLISIIAGIILICIAIFVLLSGTVLLIFRITAIWVLMVLAPFAFLFATLPQTRQYFSKWINTLMNQVFFYPAYMFMLYLVVVMINKGAVEKLMGTQLNASVASWYEIGQSVVVQKANIMLSYVFLGILMMMSLVVAKQMGAYGSSMAQGFAKGTMRKGGSYLNRAIAPISERALRVTSNVRTPVIGAVVRPFARAISSPLAASVRLAQKDREATAKSQAALAKDLPAKAAASMSRTLNARAKADLWEGMKDEKKRREFTQAMGEKDQVNFAKAIHATDPSKKYEQQVAVASGNIATAMKILGHDQKGELEKQREADNFLNGLSNKEKKEFLKPEAVRKDSMIQNHIINNFSISDVGRTVSNAEEARAMGELLERAKGDERLKAVNPKLYNRLNSSPGGVIIIDRLKSGQVLRPSDYGQERKREKDGGANAPKQSPIITPSEGFGGGARTQEE